MKKKTTKIIIILFSVLLLTGCTKNMKDEDGKIIKNEETGQILAENIICKPTSPETLKIYQDNNIDISKLPDCEKFNALKNYEGLWTSIFVKPLAWLIIQFGKLLNNYGLSIIVTCLIIRLMLYPFTKKTAMQSELIKKAQPELTKLEKKYENKTSQEDQTKKAQEMMLIYQKYKINPMSGCLIAFIQIPLLFGYYEAINRTPAIFEDTFLFNLGTTPWVGITSGKYYYLLLVILIFLATFISFRKTMKDQSTAQMNMNYMLYFMLALITYSSFTMSSAIGIYWVTSNLFTIVQNLIVERKKAK